MRAAYQQKKSCRELRAAGLTSLRGKWAIAIVGMLLAVLLGATLGGGSVGITVGFSGSEDASREAITEGSAVLESAYACLPDLSAAADVLAEPFLQDEALGFVLTLLGVGVWVLLGIMLAVNMCIALFLGTSMRIGHLRFRLRLLDGDGATVGAVFSAFDRSYLRAIGLRILRGIYLFLWSLPALILGAVTLISAVLAFASDALSPYVSVALPSIPALVPLIGLAFSVAFAVLPIVARYRYAMSDYVLAENPDGAVVDALRESARMMKGQKWHLFCLQLSFLGWMLLGLLSFGIGYLWINPYFYQSEAAFYHYASGRAAIREAVEGMSELMAEL